MRLDTHSGVTADELAPQIMRPRLSAGAAHVDIYWRDTAEPAPLVIVAHGFARRRHNMSGWGRLLAEEGFVVAVPDLPAWSDHAAQRTVCLPIARSSLCQPALEPTHRLIARGADGILCWRAGYITIGSGQSGAQDLGRA